MGSLNHIFYAQDVLNTVTELQKDVRSLMQAVGFLAQTWYTSTSKDPELSDEELFTNKSKYSLRATATEEIMLKFVQSTPNDKGKQKCVGGLVKKLFSPSEFQTLGSGFKSATPPSNQKDKTSLSGPAATIDPIYIPVVSIFFFK